MLIGLGSVSNQLKNNNLAIYIQYETKTFKCFNVKYNYVSTLLNCKLLSSSI